MITKVARRGSQIAGLVHYVLGPGKVRTGRRRAMSTRTSGWWPCHRTSPRWRGSATVGRRGERAEHAAGPVRGDVPPGVPDSGVGLSRGASAPGGGQGMAVVGVDDGGVGRPQGLLAEVPLGGPVQSVDGNAGELSHAGRPVHAAANFVEQPAESARTCSTRATFSFSSPGRWPTAMVAGSWLTAASSTAR